MDRSGGKNGRRRSVASERPTLRDVAEVAGVSFKTVARVINGEPSVRPATAERVMAAVRELGFRRNVIAADFARGGNRDQVGLVIDDVSNPFWAKVTRAIEDVVSTRGMRVIVASSDFEPEREHRIIDSLVAQRLAGLVIVPVAPDHHYLAHEMRHGTAIVFLDRPQGHLRADTVTFDDYGGARSAVEHLISQGHRRIAALTQPLDLYTMAERFRGFRDALAAAGLPVEDDLVRHDLEHAEDAREAAIDLLRSQAPPTAIFCANNRMSVGAVGATTRAPRQVALIGFDDLELADSLATPLTVVRADAGEMGHRGAELLLRRMDGWTGRPRRIVLPTELVARGSGEVSPS